MAAGFGDTTRALAADRARGGTLVALAIGLLVAGWVAWVALARVPLYQHAPQARVEVVPAPTRGGAPLAGRIAVTQLEVGRRVAAGEILVELDTAVLRGELARARDQAAALAPELAALERQLADEARGVTAGDAAARASVREQLANQRAADADLAQAELELGRLETLGRTAAVPLGEVDRARAELARKRAAREALGHAADALVAGEREREAARQGRTAELERQRAMVLRTTGAARAEVTRLELELERHLIRAPIAGVLGAVTALRPGATIAETAEIATVVPDGVLQIVAAYPATAIGRLAPGQPARMKLDGFPWTRWGTVSLRVVRVANEVRDGAVRVELAIEDPHGLALAHGMTGTVDVEVESVSPAILVVRSLSERSE